MDNIQKPTQTLQQKLHEISQKKDILEKFINMLRYDEYRIQCENYPTPTGKEVHPPENSLQKVNELKQKREKLEIILDTLVWEENNIQHEIDKSSVTYTDISLFPDIQRLKIYIPKNFMIYCSSGFRFRTYHLKYDDYVFTINDKMFESYPYNIIITTKNDKIVTKNMMFLIYYSEPKKINNLFDFMFNEITGLRECVARAKMLLGIKWDPNFAFGIAVFNYFMRIYYLGSVTTFPQIYKAFERIYDD